MAFSFTASGLAFAADMAVKAPPPAPAPAPVSWTGWYAGLNFGGGWENNDVHNTVVSTSCPGAVSGCTPNQLSTSIAAAVPGQLDAKPSGLLGGGQIGFNYQFAPAWVAGIEADIQAADISGVGGASNTAPVPDFPGFFTTVTGTASEKIDFFGTVRGRVGWLPLNSLLVYGTGGLAYGRTHTNVSFSLLEFPGVGATGASSASESTTRTGWTVGGGLEWMLDPRWSVKAEYLYYDLGDATLNQTLVETSNLGVLTATANIASTTHYHGNIVRVGLNYQFH